MTDHRDGLFGACDSVLEPYFKPRATNMYTLINCLRAKPAMILSLKSLIIIITNHTEYFSSRSFSLFCVNKSNLLHREEQCLNKWVHTRAVTHYSILKYQALGLKLCTRTVNTHLKLKI